MQRLFSTFANGWPGKGLLLQRLLTGVVLFFATFAAFEKDGFRVSTVPEVIAAAAGIFLAFGLWTPIMGTLVAIAELWIACARPECFWISILLATLGATLAMIGPGAWSLDARLFGRKHIKTLH